MNKNTAVWPKTCDGIEQDAFEAYAKKEGMDMTEHPIHYLFMDKITDAARCAWKAGLRHAMDRVNEINASAKPCVIAHVRVEDDGLELDVGVVDGTNLQPENSPVPLFASPAENPQSPAQLSWKVVSYQGDYTLGFFTTEQSARDFCRFRNGDRRMWKTVKA